MQTYWLEKYEAWRIKCPEGYSLFERFAQQVKTAGHKRFSANALVHRMRYETALCVVEGEEFKINQNYARYLGEELMVRNPEFDGFFRNRRANW